MAEPEKLKNLNDWDIGDPSSVFKVVDYELSEDEGPVSILKTSHATTAEDDIVAPHKNVHFPANDKLTETHYTYLPSQYNRLPLVVNKNELWLPKRYLQTADDEDVKDRGRYEGLAPTSPGAPQYSSDIEASEAGARRKKAFKRSRVKKTTPSATVVEQPGSGPAPDSSANEMASDATVGNATQDAKKKHSECSERYGYGRHILRGREGHHHSHKDYTSHGYQPTPLPKYKTFVLPEFRPEAGKLAID